MVGALLSPGCGGSGTSPDPVAPVRVAVQPAPLPISGPDVAGFSLWLENTTLSVVDLTFPTSCQVLPYFVDARTGQAVTPRGGGTACLTVISRLSLQPHMSVVQIVAVKSGDAPTSGYVVLPAGDYRIYAQLEDQVYRVKSEERAFSVR